MTHVTVFTVVSSKRADPLTNRVTQNVISMMTVRRLKSSLRSRDVRGLLFKPAFITHDELIASVCLYEDRLNMSKNQTCPNCSFLLITNVSTSDRK